MIHIQQLDFAYRTRLIFNQLSLDFTGGRVYGLLGSNGAGKSSLLRIIGGLLNPRKGQIEVQGYIPFHRQPAFLQDIFMVPEEFYLPDVQISAYVKRNAPFYPRFSRELFDSYLSQFQVPVEHSLQQMSYGQKKKVLIAFALATNAKVLLMDEPTNGLDILAKSQFRKILAAALDESRCIIISTHQVKDLDHLIDHITVIEEGSILFNQPVEQITKKLSFRYAGDSREVTGALYSESSLRGNLIVAENAGEDETELDLELLYKAIVMNGEGVTRVFKA